MTSTVYTVDSINIVVMTSTVYTVDSITIVVMTSTAPWISWHVLSSSYQESPYDL